MPYILASLVHHYSWLKDNLPATHPLRHSTLWTSGTLRTLADRILLGNGKCSVTGMIASGLPPHIIHAIEVREVRNTLDQRAFAIMEALEGIPQAVRIDVLSHVQVQGAREVTYEEISRLLNEFRSQLNSDLSTGSRSHSATSGDTLSAAVEQRDATWWKLFYYDSKWSYVPEGFEFPKRLPLKEIWDLYFLGNKEALIRPYRLLAKQLSRSSQIIFSQAKQLIEYIALYGTRCVETVHTISDLYEMTHIQLNDYYELAFSAMCSRFPDAPNMRGDLSYRTLYTKVLVLMEEDRIVEKIVEDPDYLSTI